MSSVLSIFLLHDFRSLQNIPFCRDSYLPICTLLAPYILSVFILHRLLCTRISDHLDYSLRMDFWKWGHWMAKMFETFDTDYQMVN